MLKRRIAIVAAPITLAAFGLAFTASPTSAEDCTTVRHCDHITTQDNDSQDGDWVDLVQAATRSGLHEGLDQLSADQPRGRKATVQEGDTGPDVVRAQLGLARHGADLTADGDFGSLTKEWVRRLQDRYGLESDGIVGIETSARLAGPNYTDSPNPDEVGLLQYALGIPHDGYWGPLTEAAVKFVQAPAGGTPDGFAGPRTWHWLDSGYDARQMVNLDDWTRAGSALGFEVPTIEADEHVIGRFGFEWGLVG